MPPASALSAMCCFCPRTHPVLLVLSIDPLSMVDFLFKVPVRGDGCCYVCMMPTTAHAPQVQRIMSQVISPIQGVADEHFIVWMRTAALPTFRNLYGRIEHDLRARVTITFNVTASEAPPHTTNCTIEEKCKRRTDYDLYNLHPNPMVSYVVRDLCSVIHI